MINELKGIWVVNEVVLIIKDKIDFYVQYLFVLNSEIMVKLDVKVSQLIFIMDGGDCEKIYELMGFVGIMVFYMVEELLFGVYLLDVVFFDLDMEFGNFVMNYDYYWSDQIYWMVGDENKNVKFGMLEEEVIVCIVVWYKLGVMIKSLIGFIYVLFCMVLCWCCINIGGQ